MAGRVTATHRSSRAHRPLGWPAAWPVLMAALVTGPLLVERGFALRGDMVFVPDQPWKGAWLGLDGSVPRAVPSDALVSLATQVVPGDLRAEGRAAGPARRRRPRHAPARPATSGRSPGWPPAPSTSGTPSSTSGCPSGTGRCCAGTPRCRGSRVVARRLRDGVPGCAGRCSCCRSPRRPGPAPPAECWRPSPRLAVLLGRPRVRTLAAGLVVCVGLNLPWLLPGALNVGDQLAADPFGVTAFAARADTPWGVARLAAVVRRHVEGQRRRADPGQLGAGRAGPRAHRRGRRRACGWRDGATGATAASLAGLGLLGLVLAWLPTTGPGADLVAWTGLDRPGRRAAA